MSYKINGIDVSTIIKNSTVASIPGQPYVGFPVTTNSPTMRSINGPTNNQIPTSGQTSYVIGTDSLDMKFPYNISPGNIDSNNMAYYCEGVSHSLTGKDTLDTSNFKHISIQGTSGAGGGAGGGGGGSDGLWKNNKGGRGGNGGMPGFISVIDYPLSTSNNTIQYTVGTGGNGGEGGNSSSNGTGHDGLNGNSGNITTVKIGNDVTFTANSGVGSKSRGGSGNTKNSGSSHNNMAAPGTGQYYNPTNGINTFVFDPNCTTSGGNHNYTSGTALINEVLIPGHNTQTNNQPIGFPRYTNAMQNTSNGYDKDILVKFGTPITSKYLAPGNGGNGSNHTGNSGGKGQDGTLNIWLKYNPNQ